MSQYLIVQGWRGALGGSLLTFAPGEVITPSQYGETFYSLRDQGVPLVEYDAGMADAVRAFQERTPPPGDAFGVLYSFGLFGTGSRFVFVTSASMFPEPDASGVIQLADGVTYYVTTRIDLEGARIVGGKNSVILGASSENCALTSTGLTGAPLISSQYSMPIRDITIHDAEQGFHFTQGTDPDPIAIDWYGVNFSNCAVTGVFGNVENVVITSSAVLGSGPIRVTGTLATLAIGTSLMVSDGAGGALIEVQATATITRRLRVIYSSFVVLGGDTGLDVDVGATIPVESYILDTVNFSGPGTYLAGVMSGENESLFVRCVGISNTSVTGQIYMNDNATATPLADTVTFVKALGTTTANAGNALFDSSNNRLTCRAIVRRRYIVTAYVSFTTGNNNVVELGIYSSDIAGIVPGSSTKSTANGAGRAEGAAISCLIEMQDGEYVEVHLRNTTGTTSVTVVDLNFTAIEIAS